ncbi:MAG TPA: hypothetical protein VK501_18615 [Baekduia sp.]|uniref:hypothetical protein n=1 Tax=Baekduia sp. TaxID=2600305 RepID=UPI002B8B3A75|nr:hypothetical protein [Baekduia sp.]HMJ35924.1 hypothetical protein [Baekduia sp.]
MRRGLLIVLATILLAAASPAAADAVAGFRDFAWQAMSVNGPTGEKPQSKLWYNDGIWWGDMFDVASSKWMIFRLDRATQTWVNTGTPLDVRPASWADTLWDGSHLYVASAGVNAASASDSAKLYRYSYSPTTKTYVVDAGFPVTIVSGGMEAIVLDRDSTGALWATWTRGNQVYVNATNGTDTAWGTPFLLPVAGTTVTPDDISSVVSLKGGVGVMWSNQVDNAMYFSEHRNGDASTAWGASTKVVQGANMADDHINLKSMQEIDGQVFATVKTSLSDISGNAGAPLLLLLKRDASAGTWSTTPISAVRDDQTRPIVMLDPSQDKLYVFATTPVGGGTINAGTADTAIFYKTTSMSHPSFGSGPGTPFIQTAGDLKINNATSTKQTVSAGTGVVVLASDNVSGFYMHNTIAPTTAPPGPTNPGGPGTTTPSGPGTATPGGPAITTTSTSASDGPATGQGTVAPNVCPVSRSAVVRWIPPKGHRMVSIVVNVAGKRYAKLKGARRSITVHLGKLPGPFRIEIRGRSGSGRVYAAVSTVSGCGVPSARAHRLVRVVHRR